ncbi:MAG: hypothetical protein KDC44_21885, partial [Phaeodactylibacter sp.]|nr:hypothetical protein [Phaeodactylibacter sp.]
MVFSRFWQLFLLCVLLLYGWSVQGQVSLLLGYERLDVGRWNLLEGPSSSVLKDGLTLGLASEFSFGASEWSLVPCILYSRFHHEYRRQGSPAVAQMAGPGLQLGIRMYPLQFLLNCEDCQSLQEGWFVEPQLGWQ